MIRNKELPTYSEDIKEYKTNPKSTFRTRIITTQQLKSSTSKVIYPQKKHNKQGSKQPLKEKIHIRYNILESKLVPTKTTFSPNHPKTIQL